MGPLDLALAGSSLFSGVGGAIDSGTNAGKSGDLSTMRNKEMIGGGLILVTGIAVAIKQKRLWPIAIAVVVAGLLIALHEWHAAQNAPQPDQTFSIVRIK